MTTKLLGLNELKFKLPLNDNSYKSISHHIFKQGLKFGAQLKMDNVAVPGSAGLKKRVVQITNPKRTNEEMAAACLEIWDDSFDDDVPSDKVYNESDSKNDESDRYETNLDATTHKIVQQNFTNNIV
ncbi:hypothetical protein FQA39_LY18383 [Lamprigera yunnana]|nr:hypothetical protein FQA39_LY18383 [Lamprigera yunnana]